MTENAKPTYVVRCRVSGGVTGTREALLKANGVVRYFTTRKSAAAVAKDLTTRMNNAYAVTFFEYWAEEAA